MSLIEISGDTVLPFGSEDSGKKILLTERELIIKRSFSGNCHYNSIFEIREETLDLMQFFEIILADLSYVSAERIKYCISNGVAKTIVIRSGKRDYLEYFVESIDKFAWSYCSMCSSSIIRSDTAAIYITRSICWSSKNAILKKLPGVISKIPGLTKDASKNSSLFVKMLNNIVKSTTSPVAKFVNTDIDINPINVDKKGKSIMFGSNIISISNKDHPISDIHSIVSYAVKVSLHDEFSMDKNEANSELVGRRFFASRLIIPVMSPERKIRLSNICSIVAFSMYKQVRKMYDFYLSKDHIIDRYNTSTSYYDYDITTFIVSMSTFRVNRRMYIKNLSNVDEAKIVKMLEYIDTIVSALSLSDRKFGLVKAYQEDIGMMVNPNGRTAKVRTMANGDVAIDFDSLTAVNVQEMLYCIFCNYRMNDIWSVFKYSVTGVNKPKKLVVENVIDHDKAIGKINLFPMMALKMLGGWKRRVNNESSKIRNQEYKTHQSCPLKPEEQH